jgi:CotH protein
MRGPSRVFARRVAAIALGCLGLLAVLLPGVAAADEAGPLFDPAAVATVDFTLPPASLQKLEDEPETDEYQHAAIAVEVDGQSLDLADVGFRLKGGAGSFRKLSGKAAFKVKFNAFVKGQKLLGLKKLTLNNMVQDPSMTHETLSYELFRAMGLPAARTGFAFVRVNGEPYGVYLDLETYDDVMLPRLFASTQHLYEADAPGTDVTTGSATSFEVDEGSESDISDLEALIAAVNDEAGDWSENVAPFADLEQMTGQWAVERFVAHWDGYAGIAGAFRPNNYYLHSDAAGVFQMMPWGTDQTWERDDLAFDEPAGGIMFDKCLEDASCKQLYLEGLTAVHCTAPGLDEASHAGQLATMLAPYQAEEDEAKRETSPAEIAEEVENVQAFAALRPEQLTEYLTAEGVIGSGPNPCGEPPAPESQAGPARTETTAPETTARIGRSHLNGRSVATALAVTGAARATERVFAPIDGHRRKVCSGRAARTSAGRLLVRCRLPGWALDRLASGPIELAVKIGFDPDLGESRVVGRSLTLPRR